MTNDQSTALRLADAINSDFDPDWMYETGLDQIAAELRRLQAENESLKSDCIEQARILGMGAERELKLIAENEALLAALKDLCKHFYHLYDSDWPALARARAALARAGETK